MRLRARVVHEHVEHPSGVQDRAAKNDYGFGRWGYLRYLSG
ncbi:MAG TPA: hypothetical protein VIH91_00030 [Terriglobales bacterium]